MLCLPEYLSTVFRASYPGCRISVLYRDLEGLYFSRLEGSGNKQIIANSMHRKDYPWDCCRSGQLAVMKARTWAVIMMATGEDKLSPLLLGSAPSNRFVNSLTARLRLMTIAVSQS